MHNCEFSFNLLRACYTALFDKGTNVNINKKIILIRWLLQWWNEHFSLSVNYDVTISQLLFCETYYR